LKRLNESLESKLKSFDYKSLDDDLNEIEQAFRNPNVLIAAIQEIEVKQQRAIEVIQSKLCEMNQVRVNIKRTNEFKPNVSFSKDWFGQLSLNNYSNDIFSSQILTGNQPSDLLKLCDFALHDEWMLLYRGSRDGFGAADFHSKCDDRTNTLTIFKAESSSYVFGGFTSLSWNGSNRFKTDLNGFLFSLTNKDNKPCKMNSQNPTQGIYCTPDCGPTFGRDVAKGIGIYLTTCAKKGKTSWSILCCASKANSFLAEGFYRFQLSEIEVYQKV
jgi:hypothetical protein